MKYEKRELYDIEIIYLITEINNFFYTSRTSEIDSIK